jgi:hypothetical protein
MSALTANAREADVPRRLEQAYLSKRTDADRF